MKYLSLVSVFVVSIAACAGRPGSSPSVPKEAIEKGADTKIPDADAGSAETGVTETGPKK